MQITVLISCTLGHEFTAPIGDGPFALLCACNRAILTGNVRNGRLTSRVEVLHDG